MDAYRQPGRLCLVVVGACLALARPGPAQTYTWVSQTPGNWSNPANWLTPPGVPVSGTGTVVEFDLVGVNSSFNATQDISPTFQVNQFVFNVFGNIGPNAVPAAGGQPIALVANGPSPPAILQNNFGIGGVSAALPSGTLIGGGGTGALSVGGTLAGSVTLDGNANLSVGLVLPTGGDATFNGTGRPTVTLQGLSGTTNRVILDFGPGAVSLGSSAAYTAANGVELRSGTMTLAGTNNLLGAATNALVVKGGTVASVSSSANTLITLPNPIRLDGSDLVITGTTALTLQGAITTVSGTPGLRIADSLRVTLLNSADHPGPTVIGPNAPIGSSVSLASLTLDTDAGTGNAGRLTATSSIAVNRGGMLTLSNANGVNNDRVPTVPLALNGGQLAYSPLAGAANSETFGDLTLRGQAVIFVPNSTNPATTTALQFGTLTQGSRGTLNIVGPVSGGPASAAVSKLTFAAPLTGLADPLGGGPTNLPVVPFISGNSTSNSDSSPRDLYTPDGNGVRALGSAEVDTVAAGGALVPHTNNLVTGSPAPLAPGTTVRVNALRSGSAIGGAFTVFGGTGSTLQVYSGQVVALANTTLSMPVLDFADRTGYLFVGSGITVNSSITGSAGLVVTAEGQRSSGQVTLRTANPFTGGLTINGTGQNGAAILSFTADDQLGAAGGGITLAGGQLQMNAPGAVTVARPLTVTEADGTIFAGGPLTYDLTGSTGPGRLTLGGTNLRVTGTGGWTGGTNITATTLQFTGEQNFGPGPINLFGTLKAVSAGTLTRTIVSNSGQLDTAGFDWTLSGTIQGTGFTKSGAGTLTVTTPQPLTGGVSLTAGALTLTGNGAFGNVRSVSVPRGDTLTLDDTAGNFPNRLPAQVSLGGELVVRGNAAGTAESTGTLFMSSSSSTPAVVSLRPAPGASVELHAAGFFGNTGLPLVVRGPGLGGSGPNTSRLTLSSPPQTVGGIVPNVLIDFDPVAGTGSFLTRYDPVQGLVPVNPGAATAVIQNAAPTNTPTTADVLVSNGVTRDAANTIASLTFAPGATLTAEVPTNSTLNLTSGSLFVRAGGAVTVSGVSFATPTGVRFRPFTNSDLTVAGLAAGDRVEKNGTGSLTFTGPVTVAGSISVVAGSVTLTADSTASGLSGSGTVTIGPGATLTLNGGSTLSGPLNGGGNLVRTANAQFSQAFGAVNLTGDIENRGTSLQLLGPVGPAPGSRLILGDNVPSSVSAVFNIGPGATIDRDFIVTASNAAAGTVVRRVTVPGITAPVTFTGPVTLNHSLQVDRDTVVTGSTAIPTVTFANAVTGPGQMIVATSNVNLATVNSFTGGVAFTSTVTSAVVLGVGDNGSLGLGPLTVTTAGMLRADNGPRTLANPVTFAGGTYLGLTGTNALTLTGPTDLNGGTRSVENAAPGAVLTLGDVIGTGASNLRVNQAGAILFANHGAVRLAGTGSYAGTTSVAAGTFLVDGTLTPSTSAVTVNGGAALGGTGTINRPISVSGTLAPGDSPGILTVTQPVTMAAGSVFAVEADGPTAGANGYDQLNLAGGGSIGLGGATLVLSFGNGYVPADATHGDTLTIISGASSLTGQFAQGTSIVVNGQYPAQILYGQTPGTVQVQFQPIPEPSALLLAGLGAGVVSAARRRWRAQGTTRQRGRP
ncbi:MAG TPA: hypothetical protein VGF55_07605 [Gemmataceae bacterium]|jgi:autotransporter-associated beta strand protein